MLDSTFIVFWHGNGDVLISLPSIKAYCEKYPNKKVGIATLQNRGKVPVDLLAPYVNEVFPIALEPWDWQKLGFKSFEEARQVCVQQCTSFAKSKGYNEIIEITMAPLMGKHKGTRVAMELGVYPLESYTPILKVPEEYDLFGKRFISKIMTEADIGKEVMFFHGVGGNVNKTLSIDVVNRLFSENAGIIIECGSNYSKSTVKYVPRSIYETIGIINNVNKVICIDSIVMHIALALNKPMDIVFTITDPELIFKDPPNDKIRIIKCVFGSPISGISSGIHL